MPTSRNSDCCEVEWREEEGALLPAEGGKRRGEMTAVAGGGPEGGGLQRIGGQRE